MESRVNLYRRSKSALFFLVPVLTSAGILLVSDRLPSGALQIGVTLLVLLPALLLAFGNSRYLIVYALGVWAFGPELRRLIDWSLGQYQPITILSVLPLLVTITLIIPMLGRPLWNPPALKKAWGGIILALLIGTVIGAVRNGFAFLYDLVNYAVPLLVLLYAASRPADMQERDVWIRGFVVIAFIVAGYGWVQFLFAPPWDVFWMNNTPMNAVSSSEPLQIRVFSTLNSPGPAALFLALAAAPAIIEPRWRSRLGWPGAALLVSALALTLVRSSWLLLIVLLTIYLLLSSDRNRYRKLLTFVGVGAVLCLGFSVLPGGSIVASRVQSLLQVSQDDSYRERSEFTAESVSKLLANPIGTGLGSIGLVNKISGDVDPKLKHWKKGATGYNSLDFDNGFLAIFLTFGVLGGLLFFSALGWIGALLRSTIRLYSDHPQARLALATLIAGTLLLASGNNFTGVSGMFVWFFISLPFGRAMAWSAAETRPARYENVIDSRSGQNN